MFTVLTQKRGEDAIAPTLKRQKSRSKIVMWEERFTCDYLLLWRSCHFFNFLTKLKKTCSSSKTKHAQTKILVLLIISCCCLMWLDILVTSTSFDCSFFVLLLKSISFNIIVHNLYKKLVPSTMSRVSLKIFLQFKNNQPEWSKKKLFKLELSRIIFTYKVNYEKIKSKTFLTSISWEK